MIPIGYMAKRIVPKPETMNAPKVEDIYSVSNCINDDFADYITYWRHNGYWFFDSPEIIVETARDHSIDLQGTNLFYYEAHELEFSGSQWRVFAPEPSMATNVLIPANRRLDGFDVVTFHAKTNAECSPLSCNSIARDVPTNVHCLFDTLEEAMKHLDGGVFKDGEPEPYRVFAVYSVPWEAGGAA